jgi:hypothetical protein
MCKFRLLAVVVVAAVFGIGSAQSTYVGNQAGASIRVTKVNTIEVKKYEKFEVELELAGIDVKNHYDPEEIDVYAKFTSPDGKTVRINGFYDNYKNANKWKVRFSPGTVGQWEYRMFVRNGGREAESDAAKFTAVGSKRHGWIRPSKKNPHYFARDDGTSYYGVGAYLPWNDNTGAYTAFAASNANFIAIWNINYGGYVSGSDVGVFESELGRYNQLKCGRMDEVLDWFEEKDIKMMFAIWPHDLFSQTVWSAKWSSLNPYSKICNAIDVYSDPNVWEYQKKAYRYLVARFGHSEALGIWELINEMNGTDGWAKGREKECYDWVEKCRQWFTENDSYHHPMTASFSGAFNEYREPLYSKNEIANIHIYSQQGWPVHYPEDLMRSEIYNFAWASQRFWKTFEKPAIFGEAGIGIATRGAGHGSGGRPVQESSTPATSTFSLAYHNIIWACLSNGLAAIPVWWTFSDLGPQDRLSIKHLAKFVSDIDFANLPFKPAAMTADGADASGLVTDAAAFGWIWSYAKDNVGGTVMTVEGLADGAFNVDWFDTWTGETVKSDATASAAGKLSVTAPDLAQSHRDIAFKIGMEQPSQKNMPAGKSNPMENKVR